MNIRITHNWISEFLETDATPEEMQKYLSLSGPAIERIEKKGDDYIYDIEITSNRVDTASVYGICRETAAILSQHGIKAKLKTFPFPPVQKVETSAPLTVMDASNLCNRILAVVIDTVSVQSSPAYIRERLEAAGIRSINNLVDITNYVMTEIGFPTHVFDYDRIGTGKLIVRYAKKNESIVTLDKKTYHLSDEDIIIDDGTGRVVDFPGIMGADNSVVTSKTKRVIFFMESNNPIAIRRSSMRHGIRTIAATINEKSPDPETAKLALLRGIELFQKLAEGKVAGPVIDLYPAQPKIHDITVRYDFIRERIGVDIKKEKIIQILKDLQFTVSQEKTDTFVVTPPSFRSLDVTISEDIVEEVARIYGYQNIPGKLQSMAYVKEPKESELFFSRQSRVKYFLKHLGLHEVMNYSMISKEMIEVYDADPKQFLRLSNTISSEIEYMRQSLLPSLVKNCKDNEGKRDKLLFFEVAKVYIPRKNDLPEEIYKLGIVVNTDFQDLKGIVDGLFAEFNIELKIKKSQKRGLLGQTIQGELLIDDRCIGLIGQLDKKYELRQQLSKPVYLAEIDLQSFINHIKQFPKYRPLNPFATIKLDLTLELTPGKTYQEIVLTANKTSKLLDDVEVVTVYKNKLSLRFYFSSDEKNITEETAKKELDKISKEINAGKLKNS